MIPKTVALITKPSVASITLSPGKYKFECWGAQGGTGLTNGEKLYEGGKGAYTSGIILLNEEKNEVNIQSKTVILMFEKRSAKI